MEINKHWFGLPVPEGVVPVRAWGARAILRVHTERKAVRVRGKIKGYDLTPTPIIETVPDRSQYRGPEIESPEARAFFKWLDKTAMPKLRKDADRIGLALYDDLELKVDDGRYQLRANPKKSYGYLYIVAWEARDGTQA